MDKNLKRMATMNRMQMTGLELFYAQGYYNTSIDDILKSLNLSKGAFYYHFSLRRNSLSALCRTSCFARCTPC